MNEHVVEAVVRATVPGREPLDLPSTARLSKRFHRAGEPVPLYAAYGRPTAQLEAQRSLGVPLDGAVLRISELKFVGRVFDVTTAAGQRTAGVSREALTGDSYEPCHELADFVRRRYPEADAVRVPSAADGAGVNLVVWHDRVAVTLTVVRSELVVVTFDDRA